MKEDVHKLVTSSFYAFYLFSPTQYTISIGIIIVNNISFGNNKQATFS